jgi:hypothetical protein
MIINISNIYITIGVTSGAVLVGAPGAIVI